MGFNIVNYEDLRPWNNNFMLRSGANIFVSQIRDAVDSTVENTRLIVLCEPEPGQHTAVYCMLVT